MKISDKLVSAGIRRPEKIATTSERLQKIIDIRQMKQADLARATGISRGAISNYVQGRYKPKSDIVQILSKALNCSENWLWGYDVPMEKSVRAFNDEENPYALEIADTLDTMEPGNQIYVKDWVTEFAKNPEKMKKYPSEQQLTEVERLALELFRKIPEDKQAEALDLLRVALKMQQRP